MNRTFLHVVIGAVVLALTAAMVAVWTSAAAERVAIAKTEGKEAVAAVAAAADEGYCTPELRLILKRVLTSCGLLKEGQKRGCQPMQAKNVAAMSGGDFNALFKPMAERASIIQFEQDKSLLDDRGKELLDKTFADQRGASYFFIVSRASPEGAIDYNRELSEKRAQVLFDYLKLKYNDPDLEQEVGMLWLGEEYAQLDKDFCNWRRSYPESECKADELNRSAFIAWIDCRL
jgi:outer membrane protein OmpA-like peptidoglycan-associated protein